MRKRIVEKHFRLSFEEDEKLKKLAALSKLSERALITSLLENTVVREAPPKDFYLILEELRLIGNNIEKLTKIANATGVIYSATLDKYMALVKKMHDDMWDKYF